MRCPCDIIRVIIGHQKPRIGSQLCCQMAEWPWIGPTASRIDRGNCHEFKDRILEVLFPFLVPEPLQELDAGVRNGVCWNFSQEYIVTGGGH